MVLNINNNINQNITGIDNNTPKKTVELHTIFSSEVIANTEKAFEKMLNLKIIDTHEFENAKSTIEKIKTDKKNVAGTTTTNIA
jgi:hypothetical protein